MPPPIIPCNDLTMNAKSCAHLPGRASCDGGLGSADCRLLGHALRLPESRRDLGELAEFGAVVLSEDGTHASSEFHMAIMILFVTGIYHFNGNVISRSDGRSE